MTIFEVVAHSGAMFETDFFFVLVHIFLCWDIIKIHKGLSLEIFNKHEKKWLEQNIIEVM